jgi:hypothetical protein
MYIVKRFALILLAILPVCAQTLPPIRVPGLSPDLVSYLQLTPQQVTDMGKIQSDFAEFQASRYQRMAQVQLEIAAETQKSPLDPMALGVRYAEVETIRRELSTESDAVGVRMRNVLTDVQKAKTKTLEDAAKLLPLVSQAQCAQLLPPPTVPTSANSGYAGFLLGMPASIVPVTGAISPCPYYPVAAGPTNRR